MNDRGMLAMPMIYVENLSKEYSQKLCNREMSEEEVEALAKLVSQKYFMHRKGFLLAAMLLPSMTLAMAVMSYYSPVAQKENMSVIMGSFLFTLVVELFILWFVYYIGVVKVPRQFARCLNKGYPELNEVYGYKRIVDGSLWNGSITR
jgi:hypothetical protein